MRPEAKEIGQETRGGEDGESIVEHIARIEDYQVALATLIHSRQRLLRNPAVQ